MKVYLWMRISRNKQNKTKAKSLEGLRVRCTWGRCPVLSGPACAQVGALGVLRLLSPSPPQVTRGQAALTHTWDSAAGSRLPALSQNLTWFYRVFFFLSAFRFFSGAAICLFPLLADSSTRLPSPHGQGGSPLSCLRMTKHWG